jgi:hypothetical protein
LSISACGRITVGGVLYRPEAFDPLTDGEWVEARVRNAIHVIAADAARGRARGGRGRHSLWTGDIGGRARRRRVPRRPHRVPVVDSLDW